MAENVIQRAKSLYNRLVNWNFLGLSEEELADILPDLIRLAEMGEKYQFLIDEDAAGVEELTYLARTNMVRDVDWTVDEKINPRYEAVVNGVKIRVQYDLNRMAGFPSEAHWYWDVQYGKDLNIRRKDGWGKCYTPEEAKMLAVTWAKKFNEDDIE